MKIKEQSVKPFLKWPGGKRRVLSKIKAMLPHGKRFIEPFFGSGAVGLNVNYETKIVADRNADLINLYDHLIREQEQFIRFCRQFFTEENNIKEKYNEYRDLFNSTQDLRLKAALFLYLNKHGFNGLCRYTLKGLYNVPFGNIQVTKAGFPEQEMRSFINLTKNITIKCCDFRKLFKEVQKNDVVYCDPPYVPLSSTSRLTQYSPFKFDLADHKDLAQCAQAAVEKGAKILISNHDTNFTRQLYQNAKIETLHVQRNVSCNSSSRVKTKELIASWGYE